MKLTKFKLQTSVNIDRLEKQFIELHTQSRGSYVSVMVYLCVHANVCLCMQT